MIVAPVHWIDTPGQSDGHLLPSHGFHGEWSSDGIEFVDQSRQGLVNVKGGTSHGYIPSYLIEGNS